MKPLSLSKPHVIITIGIPGSGKSFFAEHFATSFKAPIVSFERVRKELIESPTLSSGEDKIVNKITNYLLEEVLKTGRTVVYDGQTGLRIERVTIVKKARDAGYEPLFVWIQTDLTTAKKRATRHTAGKITMTDEQFDNKMKRFSAPHFTEKAIVVSGMHTYNSQLKIVLKRLVEPRAKVDEQPAAGRTPTNRHTLIR